MTSNNSFYDAFHTAYTQAPILHEQCNILVIGKTGVGKSTLTNAIFGERLAEAKAGKPVTKNIKSYKTKNCPVTVYDSPGLELSSDNLFNQIFFDHKRWVKKEVLQLIDIQMKLAPKEHIHVIWYCINNTADKIEKAEEEWIKQLRAKGLPVIIVLTKASQETNKEFLNCLAELPTSHIIPVLAQPQQIHHSYTMQAHGLEQLVKTTAQLIPEVAKIAFTAAIKSLDFKAHTAAFWLTHTYIPSAFIGPFLINVPFIGSKGSAALVQMTMLGHISGVFDLAFDLGFISTLFCAANGIGLEFGVEELLTIEAVKEGLKIDSLEDVVKHILNNITESIHSLVKEVPAEIPVFGGAIAGSSAAVSTLVMGLAYIDILKEFYKQAEFDGKKLSVSELGGMLHEKIEYYANNFGEVLKLLLASGSSNFQQSF
jgi:predicted GTPase